MLRLLSRERIVHYLICNQLFMLFSSNGLSFRFHLFSGLVFPATTLAFWVYATSLRRSRDLTYVCEYEFHAALDACFGSRP